MKRIPILKSTLGLLVVAGVCMPLPSSAEGDRFESTHSYRETDFYDNVRDIQSVKTEPGAQGPVRSETMEPRWSYGEAAFYDNLRKLQAARPEPGESGSGAQGPVRTETMEPTWSYGEGAFYDNLKAIHSGE